jgi:hypothetical protein
MRPALAVMDDLEMAAAVPEMLRLARELVPMLLEGEDARLKTLLLQWQTANVTISAASSCGFYADIAVLPDTPRVQAASLCGGNAVIPVLGCREPAGCVLYVADGALHFLEVYNVVAWEKLPVFGPVQGIRALAFPATVVGKGQGA